MLPSLDSSIRLLQAVEQLSVEQTLTRQQQCITGVEGDSFYLRLSDASGTRSPISVLDPEAALLDDVCCAHFHRGVPLFDLVDQKSVVVIIGCQRLRRKVVQRVFEVKQATKELSHVVAPEVFSDDGLLDDYAFFDAADAGLSRTDINHDGCGQTHCVSCHHALLVDEDRFEAKAAKDYVLNHLPDVNLNAGVRNDEDAREMFKIFRLQLHHSSQAVLDDGMKVRDCLVEVV